MKEIIDTSKEIVKQLAEFRKKHKDINIIYRFIAENRNVVRIADHLSYTITSSSLSRAKNWAKASPAEIQDARFQQNNSITVARLTEALEVLNKLSALSTDKLNSIITRILEHDEKGKTSNGSVNGLHSFAGTYISFHPDTYTQNSQEIKEGTLTLSINKAKNRSLKAQYVSAANHLYKGECEQKGETLFISVKDSRETIHMIGKVGLRKDANSPIIQVISCSLNNMGNPISFRRILVREEFKELYEAEIRKFLIHQHDLQETELLTIEELRKKNQELEIPDALKKLKDKKYLSFNHFSFPARDELYQNTWEFFERGGKLQVVRRGANGRSFTGEAFIIKNHLCISLTNDKDSKDQRLYYADFSDLNSISKGYETIGFIGIGINVVSSAVAGRELLIIYKQDSDLAFEPAFRSPQDLQKSKPYLHDQVFSFIGHDENAIFPLKVSHHPLDEAIHGHYFAYYLSSANKKLMRNRAIIGRKHGRDFFHYETDESAYTVISLFYKEPHINIRLKDRRQEMYFSFHLEVGKLDKGKRTKPELIMGSSSAIGLINRKPVASGIILLRTSEDAFHAADLGWQDSSSLNEQEKQIKDYLFLAAANPMVFHPTKKMSQLSESLLKDHKDRFMQFFSEQIQAHVHNGLKATHRGFIEDLLKIIEGFTAEKQVEFKTQYVQLFRIFFHEVLQHYTGSDNEFFATSYPKEQYFWHGKNPTEDLMISFIERGGKIHRVFFLDSEHGLPNKNELSIIERHYQIYGKKEINGGLFVANTNKLSKLMVFSTEKQGYISWDVSCNLDRSIRKLIIFTDKAKHDELRAYHQEVIKNEAACIRVTQELINRWKKNQDNHR